MSEPVGGPYDDKIKMGRGFPGGPPIRDTRYRGPRDRGGYNEGAAWNRRPARRDMDIVDKELNRYQPAFDHVQRYPEGYGGQPVRGGRGGGRRGGGGWDDNKFDRFIGAIEGIAGRGGGNITNTFNPTFNPTNVNAGRDIRDTAILGGDNQAGRDIVGAGSGDVETGDGGGGNIVDGGGNVDIGGGDTGNGDTGNGDTGNGDTGNGDDTNKYDTFINKTYNDLLGRDVDDEGKTYWKEDMDERGQTEEQVISNIKLGDEYKNREAAKGLASSMEGKTYEKDTASSLGNINEASLDAWVGPGGGLTQSADPTGKTYYEGVGDKEKASLLLNSFSGDLEDGQVGLPAFSPLDDRQEKIYDLYQNVFGRNPDEEGLKYWTGAGGEGMSLADIEASFKGSAEQKLRDQVSGTNNFVSTDDYIAGKQNRGVGESGATNEDRSSANVSGTVDNYLELLGAKDTLIGDKDTLLADKDTLLGDKDALLGAKDQLISDFNTDQAAKDDLISRFTADQAAKDKQIADLQQQLTGGNTTITQVGGGNNNAGVTTTGQNTTTSQTVDDWLQQAYTDAGLGAVDAGGRDYWTKDISDRGQTKEDVIANIMRHKK